MMFTSFTLGVLKSDARAAATILTWQAQVGSKLPISVDPRRSNAGNATVSLKRADCMGGGDEIYKAYTLRIHR